MIMYALCTIYFIQHGVMNNN